MSGGQYVVGVDPSGMARALAAVAALGDEVKRDGDALFAVMAPVTDSQPPAGSIGEQIKVSCRQADAMLQAVIDVTAALLTDTSERSAGMTQVLGGAGEQAGTIAAGWSGSHH